MVKKQRAPRQPNAKPEQAPWPTGYEINAANRPPLPTTIVTDVTEFQRRCAEGAGYDPVLRALEWIVQARMQGVQWDPGGAREGLPSPADADAVMLPWWLVSALAGAIQKVRREGASLDEIMEIKGQGRGKRGWAQKISETGTHLDRAHQVRHLMTERGIGKMEAAQLVSLRLNISKDAVLDSINAAEKAGFTMPGGAQGLQHTE